MKTGSKLNATPLIRLAALGVMLAAGTAEAQVTGDIGPQTVANQCHTLTKAKNIIFMVPDGMGISNVTAARIFKSGPNGRPLYYLLKRVVAR